MGKFYVGTALHTYEVRELNYFSAVMYHHFVHISSDEINLENFFEECLRYPTFIYMLIILILVFTIWAFYIFERTRGRCGPGSIKIDTKGKRKIRWLTWALLLIPLTFMIFGLMISISNYQEYLDTDWEHFKERLGPVKPPSESHPSLHKSTSSNFTDHPENLHEIGLNTKCWLGDAQNVRNLLSNTYDKNVQMALELIEWIDYLRLFYGEMTTFLFSTAEGTQLVQETNFTHFNTLALRADEIFHSRKALKDLKLQFGKIVESNKSQSITTQLENLGKRSHRDEKKSERQIYLELEKDFRKKDWFTVGKCPPILNDYDAENLLIFDIAMIMIFVYIVILFLILILAFLSGLCKESNSCHKWTTVWLLSTLYLIFIYFLTCGIYTISMYTYIIHLDYEKCSLIDPNPAPGAKEGQDRGIRRGGGVDGGGGGGGDKGSGGGESGGGGEGSEGAGGGESDGGGEGGKGAGGGGSDGGGEGGGGEEGGKGGEVGGGGKSGEDGAGGEVGGGGEDGKDGEGGGGGESGKGAEGGGGGEGGKDREGRAGSSGFKQLIDVSRNNDIITQLNVRYLQDVYKKMYKYVTANITKDDSNVNLTICYLNRLKTSNFGSFAERDLFQKGKDLADMCKQLSEKLERGLQKAPAQCFALLNKLKTCHVRSRRFRRAETDNDDNSDCKTDWGNSCPHYRYFLVINGVYLKKIC